MKNTLWVAGVAMVLTACGGGGGGGGGTPADPAPAGLYRGTSDYGQEVAGLVRGNGDFWFLYSEAAGVLDGDVAGAIQGRAAARGGNFNGNGKDYQFGGDIVAVALASTYVEAQYLNGTLTAGADSVGFTLAYDDDFDNTPALADIAGEYAGDAISMIGAESALLGISAAGDLSAMGDGGCGYSGSVAPADEGNYFTVILIAGATPECDVLYAGKRFDGVLYLDGDTGLLNAAALNSSGSLGLAFSGTPALR